MPKKMDGLRNLVCGKWDLAVEVKEESESWALWGKEEEAEERRLEAPDLSHAFLLCSVVGYNYVGVCVCE